MEFPSLSVQSSLTPDFGRSSMEVPDSYRVLKFSVSTPSSKEERQCVVEALFSHSSTSKTKAIILENALSYNYTKELNDLIAEYREKHNGQALVIDDELSRLLTAEGISVTVNNGQVEMRKISSLPEPKESESVASTSTLTRTTHPTTCGSKGQSSSPSVSSVSSRAIEFSDDSRQSLIASLKADSSNSPEKRALKRQIIEHAIQQGQEGRRFLNEMFKEINTTGRTVNLSGVNLYGFDLRGINFYKVNLSGANLIRANLSEVSMLNANLTGANLSDAQMGEAILIDSILDDALMHKTQAIGAYFNGASMRGTELCEADISGASMQPHSFELFNPFRREKSTNLTGADMTGAIAIGTKFNGAILREVNFTDVRANSAKFGDSILDGAIFVNTNLTGANLNDSSSIQDMTINEKTKSTLSWWSRAYLKLSGVFSGVKHLP